MKIIDVVSSQKEFSNVHFPQWIGDWFYIGSGKLLLITDDPIITVLQLLIKNVVFMGIVIEIGPE